MTLRRLKWVFLVTALVFLVILEWVRALLYPQLHSWTGRLLMDAVVLTGILVFFGAGFEVMSRMQDRVERKHQELLGLHKAVLDIYGELSLEVVLQKVVDQARQLLEARYGAVSVIEVESHQIKQFITSGITAEQRARIGPPPKGHGLLGVPLYEGHRLRVPRIARDPRSVGFPPHHPPMHSLLAVPIVCRGPYRGNLYVAEKKIGHAFTEEDEDTLVRFATAAAIAIDNAQLHERLQALAIAEERVRIAREMHDGMAQVLAYVNTKAQAVTAFLQAGREIEATEQLEQLARAAREVYAEAREGILALRTRTGPDRPFDEALEDFLERWERQTGIVGELTVDGDIALTELAELQLLRIIQEALSNVRKHSGAHLARVTISRQDSTLVTVVEDDGAGFDPAVKRRSELPRFGLAIMRERTESIGGSLEVTSRPGEGTRVRIEIPLTAENS